MTFLDTNVLVYAADDTDEVKHRRAYELVVRAIRGEPFMVSAQVINEFCAVSHRKLKKSTDEVYGFLEIFERIKTVPVLPEWTRRALEIRERYNLQFYDSLLLAAAEANGCDEIYTEDLNDGQVYCGIKAVNPFKE